MSLWVERSPQIPRRRDKIAGLRQAAERQLKPSTSCVLAFVSKRKRLTVSHCSAGLATTSSPGRCAVVPACRSDSRRPLLARSGRRWVADQCLLSGVKRTTCARGENSAYDPKLPFATTAARGRDSGRQILPAGLSVAGLNPQAAPQEISMCRRGFRVAG